MTYQRMSTTESVWKSAAEGVVHSVAEIPDEQCRKKYDNAPEVGVAVKVISFSHLDMANNTFQADINLNIAWKGGGQFKEEDKPAVQIYNLCEGADSAEESQVKKGDAGFDWYYRIRFQGTFRQHYNLRAFPFDEQELCIRVRMKSECTLVALPWGPTGGAYAVDQDALPEDFELKTAKVEHTYLPSFKFGRLGGYDPEAVILFSVRRNHAYWMYNYGCLMSLACTFCFAMFALPVRDLGDRLGIGFTLNLTVVATFYLMQDKLPQVPYHTKLEHHMVVCIGFTMVVMVINLLPALIGYDLMERIEWMIVSALVLFWTGYHVYAAISIYSGQARKQRSICGA